MTLFFLLLTFILKLKQPEMDEQKQWKQRKKEQWWQPSLVFSDETDLTLSTNMFRFFYFDISFILDYDVIPRKHNINIE